MPRKGEKAEIPASKLPRHDPELRRQAMEIYDVTGSPAKASRETGISIGTIKKWAARSKIRKSIFTNDKIMEKSKFVISKTVDNSIASLVKNEVGIYLEENGPLIKEQIVEHTNESVVYLADKLEKLIRDTIDEIETVLEDGPTMKEARAPWLKSLVTLMMQGIDRRQLLMGEPTSREEVHTTSQATMEMTIEERAEYYFGKFLNAAEREGYQIVGIDDGDDRKQSLDPSGTDDKAD